MASPDYEKARQLIEQLLQAEDAMYAQLRTSGIVTRSAIDPSIAMVKRAETWTHAEQDAFAEIAATQEPPPSNPAVGDHGPVVMRDDTTREFHGLPPTAIEQSRDRPD